MVVDLADLKREGSYWDFKREWHGNKADLLHDIICMANNPGDTTGLVVIGIDEGTGYKPAGTAELLGKRLNTQKIVNMLRSKIGQAGSLAKTIRLRKRFRTRAASRARRAFSGGISSVF